MVPAPRYPIFFSARVTTAPISSRWGFVEGGAARLLQKLLVTALQRAIAHTQMNDMAFAVGQNLHFDMARLLQVFLHVDGVVAEGGLCFGPRGGQREFQVFRFLRHLHAAAAAARGRLDQDGIADLRRRRAALPRPIPPRRRNPAPSGCPAS